MTSNISKEVVASITAEAHEYPELIPAEISGEIPKWLRGTVIRNGPGKFQFGTASFAHWFDGAAILHSFQIRDDGVFYHSKYIESDSYKTNLANNTIVAAGFGPIKDPCITLFSKFFAIFQTEQQDNCCVSVGKIKDKTYAFTEGPYMMEIDPDSLHLNNKVNLPEDFEGDIELTFGSAHPHYDSDGTYYSLAMTYGRNTTYNIISVPPSSGANGEKPLAGSKVETSIPPTDGISYFHSFGITPNYFILAENPYTLNLWYMLIRKPMGWGYNDCLQWDPNTTSKFHIISRHTGKKVTTCEADATFIFHHINAYEDNDEIVMDACCYDDVSLIDQVYLEVLRGEKTSIVKKPMDVFVRRYHLPVVESQDSSPALVTLPKTSKGIDFELLAENVELPQINYNKNGHDYKALYGVGLDNKDTMLPAFATRLMKVNVKTKELKIWGEEGLPCIPSEPLFVPAPNAQAEDEGVVISIVLNPHTQTSFLLVLDGQTFQEVGRAEVPVNIPLGIHGTFQPAASP